MVRAKGGKRQPRYFYLKDAGAEKLVRFLEGKGKKEVKLNKVEQICKELKQTDKAIELLINSIKERL